MPLNSIPLGSNRFNPNSVPDEPLGLNRCSSLDSALSQETFFEKFEWGQGSRNVCESIANDPPKFSYMATASMSTISRKSTNKLSQTIVNIDKNTRIILSVQDKMPVAFYQGKSITKICELVAELKLPPKIPPELLGKLARISIHLLPLVEYKYQPKSAKQVGNQLTFLVYKKYLDAMIVDTIYQTINLQCTENTL